VSFALPEGQTVINPDSIAILKNPPDPELARHFMEFVLSREGQLLWMLPKGSPGGATRYVINRMSVQPPFTTNWQAKRRFSPIHSKCAPILFIPTISVPGAARS